MAPRAEEEEAEASALAIDERWTEQPVLLTDWEETEDSEARADERRQRPKA